MIKNQQRRGFTIIEVVLVLAIAGLIFLMVFIALPALQRSRADTQRRSDASAFMAQMNHYRTNNRGKVLSNDATAMAGFLKNYMKQEGAQGAAGTGEFLDPKTGNNYTVQVDGQLPTDIGKMSYQAGKTCDGEAFGTGQAREAAVIVKLEGSGFFCAELK